MQPGVWAAKSSVQALRSAAMSGLWAYARAVNARTPEAGEMGDPFLVRPLVDDRPRPAHERAGGVEVVPHPPEHPRRQEVDVDVGEAGQAEGPPEGGNLGVACGDGHMRMSNISSTVGPTRPTVAARQTRANPPRRTTVSTLPPTETARALGTPIMRHIRRPVGSRPQDGNTSAGDDVAEQVDEAADADGEAEQRVSAAGGQHEVGPVCGGGRQRGDEDPAGPLGPGVEQPAQRQPEHQEQDADHGPFAARVGAPGGQRTDADGERDRVGERAVAVGRGPGRCACASSV